MTMIVAYFTAALALAVGRPIIAVSSAPALSLTIHISASTEVKLGHPLIVDLIVTNVSDTAVSMWMHPGPQSGEMYNSYTVRDSAGRLVALTAHGAADRKGWRGGSRILKNLQPKDTLEQRVDITALYKIDHVGDYTVQAERSDPLNPNIAIKSNVMKIEVIQ